MSSTGSLRMYTEMSYIFNAEYTRLTDHHWYYELETIHFRWYSHSHSSMHA